MSSTIKKENMYKYIFFLVGLGILSFGISLIIKSNFGTSSWDSVSVGLFMNYGFSVGVWMNIVALLLVIVSGVLLKKIPRFTTLITSIFMGGYLDLWMFLIKDITITSTFMSVGVFLVGVVIIGFGVATYLVSNLPPNPLDYFMVCVSERFNISIGKARTICEGVGFVLGLIVSGPIGIGTIIILCLVGPIIQFLIKYTSSIYVKLSSTEG